MKGAAATILLLCLALSASAQPPPPEAVGPRAGHVPPPGEGVICAWAIYATMAEVGARCFPGENPALQAELRQAVSRLDAYVARNDKSATPKSMAEFKRRQAYAEAPTEELCRGDAVQMYRLIEKGDRKAEMVAELEKVLARDGPPSWGTCF